MEAKEQIRGGVWLDLYNWAADELEKEGSNPPAPRNPGGAGHPEFQRLPSRVRPTRKAEFDDKIRSAEYLSSRLLSHRVAKIVQIRSATKQRRLR